MTTINVPKKLAIYYGFPSLINNANGNIAQAVETFSQYDMVVFGATLENPAHSDHNNTIAIINSPSMNNTVCFGYINSTDTLDVIQGQIDNWQSMGIKGLFADQFGREFGLTREKQREIVWCIHNKAGGLIAFVNAFNVDDAFSPAIDPTFNPNGLPTRLSSSDYYLAESFCIINGAYDDSADNNGIKNWQDKAVKMTNYNATFGTSMAADATLGSATFTQALADYSYFASVLNNFQAWGMGEEFYSASSALLPFRTRKTFYGTLFTGSITTNGGIYERSTNIGIEINTNDHTVDILTV